MIEFQGRLATAEASKGARDCFIMEWLVITLAANVICQLGSKLRYQHSLGPWTRASSRALPARGASPPICFAFKIASESGDAFSQAIMDVMTLLRAAALRCPLPKGSGSSSWKADPRVNPFSPRGHLWRSGVCLKGPTVDFIFIFF